jgi:hypothetical protein
MALPDLTDQFVADAYKGFLHTSNVPISGGNLPPVYDGLGNKSSLKLGSDGNGASISGTLSADGLTLRGYATIIDYLYPVGAVFIDTSDVNPQVRFVGTTWSKISEGKFLAGVGSGVDKNLTAGTIAAGDDTALGEYEHTLTSNELAAHSHTQSYSGGDRCDGWDCVPDGDPLYPQAGGGEGGYRNGDTLQSTGGGQSHNNIPPYFGVYIWKRLT